MIRAALFDAVGTLIHLREPVGETYARVAHEHNVTVRAADLQAAFPHALRAMPPMAWPGRPRDEVEAEERAWWRAVVRETFAGAGGPDAAQHADRCFDRLFAHFAGAAAWQCARGAADLLGALRAAGLRTGVVSNFDLRLPPLLAALRLAALLDVIVVPADAGAAKPDRRIFDHALERLGVAAGDAVYVGDDAHDDMAGARHAGLVAIDVAPFADLRDLGAELERMRNRRGER